LRRGFSYFTTNLKLQFEVSRLTFEVSEILETLRLRVFVDLRKRQTARSHVITVRRRVCRQRFKILPRATCFQVSHI